MERVNMNEVVGGDGENGLPEKMTCMEDSMAAGNTTTCRESRCCFTSMVVAALKRTSQSW